MRHLCRFRSTLVLASLATLLALAGCSSAGTGGGGARDDAAAPTTTTVGSSAAQPSAAGDTGTPDAGDPGGADRPAATGDGSEGGGQDRSAAEQAEATAAYFMRTEVGMRQPVATPFKPTGGDTGEVGVYPGAGTEAGGPLRNAVTTVSLRRRPGGWEITATRTRDIRVSAPADGALVASPLRVAGSALAFEGTVEVHVRENRDGRDQTIGRTVVTGGGDHARPFSGTVAFSPPSTGTGWIVFFVTSAADGQVTEATAVRVRFRR